MDSLVVWNDLLIHAFPPGVKFVFDALPLKGYNMLLWLIYAILGLVAFILAVKYNPRSLKPQTSENIKKTN